MALSLLTPADAEAIRQPVRRFIADCVIPLEQEAFAAGVDDKMRIHLQQLARDAGVLAPQAPAEYGGGGADFLHPNAGEHEVHQLPHRHSGAAADQEQPRPEANAKAGVHQNLHYEIAADAAASVV